MLIGNLIEKGMVFLFFGLCNTVPQLPQRPACGKYFTRLLLVWWLLDGNDVHSQAKLAFYYSTPVCL